MIGYSIPRLEEIRVLFHCDDGLVDCCFITTLCPSAPSQRKCQTASGRSGAECQGPAVGDLHRPRCEPLMLPTLPPARMRTTVHVQHLPGDVTSFSQINDSLSDVLRVRDRTHRGKGRHEVPR